MNSSDDPPAGFCCVVWPDELGSDPGRVEVLAYERTRAEAGGVSAPPRPPALHVGEFVILEDPVQAEHWFAQVVVPQRNLPLFGNARERPNTMTSLQRVLGNDVSPSVFSRQCYHYELELLGHIQSGRLTAIKTRPRAGSLGRVATIVETVRYLDLPAMADGAANVIGRFQGVDIPITVDLPALNMHMLVCGATGSGKTNTLANLIRAAQSLGACCLVFDHKPDYQDVDAPNTELDEAAWASFAAFGLGPRALAQSHFYGLAGQDRRQADEEQFAVWASDVEPEMLSAAIFPSRSDDNQRDLFLAILEAYKAAHDGGRTHWSLADVDDWLGGLAHDSDEVDEPEDANGNGNGNGRKKKASPRNRSNVIAAALSNMLSFSVRASTFDAMNRKRLLRAPRWLDAGQKARKRANAVSTLFGDDDVRVAPRTIEFDPEQHLAARRVVVIRAPAEGREYGLFLSYILRRINQMLALRRISFPVCCFIDEAHEVFSGEKAVAEAATTSVQRAVVKGRSLGNGFVFSTQNPSQVPETILNNLNSRVIHRQNSRDELKLGIPSAPEELLNTAMTLGPGQAIVSIQGSRAPVTAEMAPSPFKLTKLTGQGARRFLIEQFEDEPVVA